MTKKDLIEKMKDLPDDAPVILVDSTTDDNTDACYSQSCDLAIDDYWDDPEGSLGGDKPNGKALFVYFENKLNPDPI